jgi:hypothetical protein
MARLILVGERIACLPQSQDVDRESEENRGRNETQQDINVVSTQYPEPKARITTEV